MVQAQSVITLSKESKRFIRQLKLRGFELSLRAAILELWDREAQITASLASRKLTGKAKRVRSGNLRRSIVGDSQMFRGVPGLRVGVLRGPALQYAGVQELGTKGYNPDSPYKTIKPKTAKYLTFPPDGSPALYPSGVPRYTSPRDYPEPLTFYPRKGTNLRGVLYEDEDIAKEREESELANRAFDFRNLQAIYLMVRRLDIKPGFFLRDSMTERLPDIMKKTEALIVKFFERKLGKA